jgi:hypothetical protein
LYKTNDLCNANNSEEFICDESFSYNWFLFFIKFKLQATTRRITGYIPSVLLFIPTGKKQVTYSYRNIAGISIQTSYKVIRMLLAVILLVLDVKAYFKPDISLMVQFIFYYIIISIIFISGIKCYMTIENNAGSRINHSIAFYEKRKATEFANEVNNALANYTV